MPNRTFLVTFPLYRKFDTEIDPFRAVAGRPRAAHEPLRMQLDQVLPKLPKPSVNMWCNRCQSPQTFVMNGEYQGPMGHVVMAPYLCAGCGFFLRVFVLYFEVGETLHVTKVGQFPPWDISVDQNLANLLGDHLNLYKQGIICESQGYGIGAHAYYRRIVETIIDQLLAELEGLIGENEREKYQEALEQTRKTKVAQHKIALVKDLLPASLRPGGTNALAVLHDALSSGLHSETDDECLEIADAVRKSLVFLLKRVREGREEAKEFNEATRKLLDKKAQKTKQEKG